MKTNPSIIDIIESGISNVQQNEEYINSLNVFPIPDGDTGTNILSTLLSGFNEINLNYDSVKKIEDFFEEFAKGCLYGARGNSGVIISQIFKGLFEGSKKNKFFNQKNLKWVKKTLISMSDYAYKSVPNPVEGTILTVIREISENFNILSKDPLEIISEILKLGQESLAKTPEKLPILKESGVVDSGGMGFIKFLEGVESFLKGKPLKINRNINIPETQKRFIKADPNKNIGYCSEFILSLKTPKKFSKEEFNKSLAKIGDSIVLIFEDDILKVHIHVKNPGDLLILGQKYGEFSKIKIENMTTQVDEIITINQHKINKEENLVSSMSSSEKNSSKTKKDKVILEENLLGIISVASGEGISKIMQKYNVDSIIEGGQTMNPSVSDFVNEIQKLPNKEVLILPNNSNIIMSAEQAIEIIKDKKVYVLPTKSIQQGLVVLFNLKKEFIPFSDYSKMLSDISEELVYGEITYSIRDVNLNGVEVNKDEFISISNKKILKSSKELFDVVVSLIDYVLEDDKEIIYIFYNNEVSDEILKKTKKYINENYDVEIELLKGDQKVYYFLMFSE